VEHKAADCDRVSANEETGARRTPSILTRVIEGPFIPVVLVSVKVTLLAIDLKSGDDAVAVATLATIGPVEIFRLYIGQGIEPGSLDHMSRVARRIDTSKVVELVGDSAESVEEARVLLIHMWGGNAQGQPAVGMPKVRSLSAGQVSPAETRLPGQGEAPNLPNILDPARASWLPSVRDGEA
jgi:hypothetical protein